MGQKCCSDGQVDNRVHDPTIHKPQKVRTSANYSRNSQQFPNNLNQNSNLHLGYKATDKQYQVVRNFAPVKNTTSLHPNVIEIQQKMKDFVFSNGFKKPQGERDELPYAINTAGMVYDRNSEWSDGMPHGQGKLIYPDGSCYKGSFIKGVPSGEGRFISSQGWCYEGQLYKEQAQGRGVFTFENIGYRYQGEWEGDLPNGRGEETWVKPGFLATYKGEYVSGKKHGRGVYKSGDQWIYQGQFSDNEITAARAKMQYKNGQFYQGGFLDGKKHGFGIYTWKDGSTYQGWYSHDKKHGHGKFITRDNKRFEGQWVDGKREGRGVLIVDGKKYPGEWKNDMPSSSKNIVQISNTRHSGDNRNSGDNRHSADHRIT